MYEFLRRPVTGGRREGLPSLGQAISALAIATVGLVLRIWVLRSPLGAPDLDEATVGLQAARFRHGAFATFFPTQNYGGTLETGLVAAITGLVGSSTIALKAAAIGLHALAALLSWRAALRLCSDRWTPIVAPGLIWVGSAAVLWQSTKERGFYGTGVVLAAAALLLVARLGDRIDARDSLGLGFVAGLAVWTSPLLVAAVLPPAAWLLLVRRRMWQQSGWVVLGALAGAAPWLAWNLGHGWSSLDPPPTFESTYIGRLADVIERLPVLLGASTPWNPSRSIAPTCISLVLVALTLAAATWATRRQAPGLLGSAVLGYLALQALNGLAVAVGPDPRYLYPLVPALAVASACAASVLPRPARPTASLAVVLLAGVLATWGTAGFIHGSRQPRPDQFVASPGLPDVIDFLDRHERRAVMTDASGHQITFLSEGRILAASYAVPRFADLEHAGWSRGLTTYVMRTGYLGGDDERLRRFLIAHDITYRRTVIGGYSVFLLRQPVSPASIPLTVFGGRFRPPAD